MPIPIKLINRRQLRILPISTFEINNERSELNQDKEEQFRSNILKPKPNIQSQVITTAFYK